MTATVAALFADTDRRRGLRATLLADPERRRGLRAALRDARASVQVDGEAYREVIFAIERLGRHLDPKQSSLGGYRDALLGLVHAAQATDQITAFSRRLWLLTQSRNEDAHTGASARRIAAEAALVLEAALRSQLSLLIHSPS
jgi:hypothetical protein